MENSEARADGGFVVLERIPSEADARIQVVQRNISRKGIAHLRKRGGERNARVCALGEWGIQDGASRLEVVRITCGLITQSEIHCQIGRHFPIVLEIERVIVLTEFVI